MFWFTPTLWVHTDQQRNRSKIIVARGRTRTKSPLLLSFCWLGRATSAVRRLSTEGCGRQGAQTNGNTQTLEKVPHTHTNCLTSGCNSHGSYAALSVKMWAESFHRFFRRDRKSSFSGLFLLTKLNPSRYSNPVAADTHWRFLWRGSRPPVCPSTDQSQSFLGLVERPVQREVLSLLLPCSCSRVREHPSPSPHNWSGFKTMLQTYCCYFLIPSLPATLWLFAVHQSYILGTETVFTCAGLGIQWSMMPSRVGGR